MSARTALVQPRRLLLRVVVVAALALLVRWMGLPADTAEIPLRVDALDYEALAFRIASGLGFTSTMDDPRMRAPVGQPTAFRTPGLPYFGALVYEVSGRRPDRVAWCLAFLDALAAGALFYSARSIFGPAAGWIAGLAWTFWPDVLRRARDPAEWWLAESLSVPLVIFALAALSLPCKLEIKAALSGILLGTSLLARPHPAPMLPLALCLGLVLARGSRRLVAAWILLVSFAVLPSVAWATRNRVRVGVFSVSSQSGVAFWVGNNESARGSSRGGWWESPELAELVRQHPELLTASEGEKAKIFSRETLAYMRARGVARFLWLEARKLALFFYPVDADWGFLPGVAAALLLAPFGLPALWHRRHRMETTFLATLAAGALITVLICFHESRYRFTAMPAFVIAAALGVVRLGELIRQQTR